MKASKSLLVLLGITMTGVFAFSAPALADRDHGGRDGDHATAGAHRGKTKGDRGKTNDDRRHGNRRPGSVLWVPTGPDLVTPWENPLGDAIDALVNSTLDQIFNGPHHRR
jgi:hypothetical protein